MDDADVIKEVNSVTSEEMERRTKKLSAKATKVTAASVNVDESSDISVLMKSVRSMLEDLKALRKEVTYRVDRGCPDCWEKRKARSCRHCWNCGKDDHKYGNCPSSPTQSTN